MLFGQSWIIRPVAIFLHHLLQPIDIQNPHLDITPEHCFPEHRIDSSVYVFSLLSWMFVLNSCYLPCHLKNAKTGRVARVCAALRKGGAAAAVGIFPSTGGNPRLPLSFIHFRLGSLLLFTLHVLLCVTGPKIIVVISKCTVPRKLWTEPILIYCLQ